MFFFVCFSTFKYVTSNTIHYIFISQTFPQKWFYYNYVRTGVFRDTSPLFFNFPFPLTFPYLKQKLRVPSKVIAVVQGSVFQCLWFGVTPRMTHILDPDPEAVLCSVRSPIDMLSLLQYKLIKKVWYVVFGWSQLCVHLIIIIESGITRELVHFPSSWGYSPVGVDCFLCCLGEQHNKRPK